MDEEREESKPKLLQGKIQEYLYYIIIGIVSFCALVFLPQVGTIDVGFVFPSDAASWTVWIVTKCLTAAINVIIFHSFIQQAKVNIKDDPKYIEATKMLYECKPKNYAPRSPQKFLGKQYGRKGVMIFILTALSTIALTMAFLYFNWMAFLSYLFTILMGVALGILEMLKVQDYWTNEYYDFALAKKRAKEEEEKETSKHDD